MKGFRDTTRIQYVQGYAKGGEVRGCAQVSKVMSRFKGRKPVKKAMGGVVIPDETQRQEKNMPAPKKTGPVAPRDTGTEDRNARRAEVQGQTGALQPRTGVRGQGVPVFTNKPLVGS